MYRVIYQYGPTEVQSLRTHDTHEKAQAELAADSDDGRDDAWIEETPS